MGLLVKIVNKWKPIANFGESSNVDDCLGSEYPFIFHIFLVEFLIYKDRSKICTYEVVASQNVLKANYWYKHYLM